MRGQDVNLREVVFRACQQTVEQAWSKQLQREEVKRWIVGLLNHFPPPSALIDHGGESDAETYFSHMIRAHLCCAYAALQGQGPSGTVSLLDTTFSDDLAAVAKETDVPLPFFHNLYQELLPKECRSWQLRQPRRSISLSALLVRKNQGRGVVTTLTLELMPDGIGTLYPAPELAFVRRDQAFRDSENAARAYVERLRLWRKDQDVRWRIQPRGKSGPLRVLAGPSMGFAFALGLAKLLVGD
jgi:hypothetical protein